MVKAQKSKTDNVGCIKSRVCRFVEGLVDDDADGDDDV